MNLESGMSAVAALHRSQKDSLCCGLLVAVVFVLVNLAVDVLYGWLDPRIRFE